MTTIEERIAKSLREIDCWGPPIPGFQPFCYLADAVDGLMKKEKCSREDALAAIDWHRKQGHLTIYHEPDGSIRLDAAGGWWERQQAGEGLVEANEPEGPTTQGAFRYNNEEYPGLKGVAWNLVDVIWKCKGKRVDLTDENVQMEIWGDSGFEPEELWENRFHYARTQANKFFRDNGIHYRVEKIPRTDFVRINSEKSP